MMTVMEIDDLDVLPDVRFDAGLAGFPAARRFALVRVGDEPGPFAVMRSLDVDDLEFVVVPSAAFFPDYAPIVDDEVAAALGLGSAEDALVLLIVTVGDPIESSTANLLGPLIVNRHTRRAVQAILAPESHSTRVPLLM
jgi:flagellar assembly factor FliW